jgi:hypothetical protein
MLERRVGFDSAVSSEPLTLAADATRMGFEWYFGTFVLPK